MNWAESSGELLLIVGGVLALVGGTLWGLSKVGFLGHLPGDIHMERPGFSLVLPLGTSILLSLVLTLLVNLVAQIVRALFGHGPR